jgi:uncharacterized protein YajQ (UPF0234 family)
MKEDVRNKASRLLKESVIRVDEIMIGDGIRVRSARTSFMGQVIKVNRTTFLVASSVWGNPVEYTVKKDDCIGGMVDRAGNIMDIV